MPEPPPTFSESWYRIADQRLSLRPGVIIRRQFFRGEQWHVVEDPFNNQFFRLQPAAYAFVARLRPQRTVQQVWAECLERDANQAPGQEEVIRLVSQLYFANLLQYDSPSDAAQLFERQQRRREREARSRWLNIMFLRIPLFDPDALIDRFKALNRLLFGPISAILWFLVVGMGLKVAVENFTALRQQSQAILAPGNLFLLYLGLLIVKSLHEFGHACMCKRFGGQVHVMGVMLLIFTPTPYMDASSSWGFRNRWHRILVGAAGMVVEVFVAALAVFVWHNTGPGTLHNLMYNIIFVASVSTVLFNGNPLLRYDGYYMLADFLGIPNLYQRAAQQLKFWADCYLFGLTNVENPARGRREAGWLTAYGLLSFAYRIVVFSGILLFVADRFLLLGILMAVVCLISWVAVPLGRFAYYLATSPQLERHRFRAIAVTAGVVLGGGCLLEFTPFPHHFRAPGILEAREKTEVANQTAGLVASVLATPGEWVAPNQPLLRLQNRELELNLAAAQARLDETQALWRSALLTNFANLKPIEQRLESDRQLIRRLESDQASLIVRAPQEGVWATPPMKDYLGRWLIRGENLGVVLDTRSFCFTATVSQNDVNRIFSSQVRGAGVRLRGQAGTVLPVGKLQAIPAAHLQLPSAALGWRAGGEVPTSPTDPEGRLAAEPFFELKAAVESNDQVSFRHGRSGQIRFNLAPKPLLQQWWQRLRQILQQRYQL
jgi:putative peptide zinc metalloprotease protein